MSNKKPFEYIEDKIKLAAENNQPAFDEKAWKDMEVLLDKEEKKRRPFFWIWFLVPFLLAGGWAGYTFLSPSHTVQEKPATALHTDADKKVAANKEEQSITSQKENSVVDLDETKNINSTNDKVPVNGKEKSAAFYIPSRQKKSIKAIKSDINAAVVTGEGKEPDSQSGKTRKEIAGRDNSVTNDPVVNNNSAIENKADLKTPDNKIAAQDAKNKDAEIKKDIKENVTTGNKKPDSKNKKNNLKKIYLLATAGTDAGSTKLFSYSNSSITPKYGVGAGYQFNNKWSVQTGFYVTNKKYVAGPGDYHPKAGTYWSMVDIQKVKAACLVFEIPITVRYNFKQSGSLTYYGAIGSSSYIMQREDYNYFYTRYNMPYEKYWEYRGHRHLFSMLTFSAGIEKKLSEKISLLAEPSFSIPIAGVGDGKVKLFSSSLQVGIKYLPFKTLK